MNVTACRSRSTTPADDKLILGRCGRPYGILGWVHVHTYTQSSDHLLQYSHCYLSEGTGWQPATFTTGKPHGKGAVIKFQGHDNREATRALTNRYIAIDKTQLSPTESDEYYWHELIGLTVINTAGVTLGTVVNLMETGAHDVLMLTGKPQPLIPFTTPIITAVDLAQQQIIADWQPDY